MRFCNGQHQYYCGTDLHVKTMYLCILDGTGHVLVHRNVPSTPRRATPMSSSPPSACSRGTGSPTSARPKAWRSCLLTNVSAEPRRVSVRSAPSAPARGQTYSRGGWITTRGAWPEVREPLAQARPVLSSPYGLWTRTRPRLRPPLLHQSAARSARARVEPSPRPNPPGTSLSS